MDVCDYHIPRYMYACFDTLIYGYRQGSYVPALKSGFPKQLINLLYLPIHTFPIGTMLHNTYLQVRYLGRVDR